MSGVAGLLIPECPESPASIPQGLDDTPKFFNKYELKQMQFYYF